MASVTYFTPNDLNNNIYVGEKVKESGLKQGDKRICIEHKEAAQPLEKMLSSMIRLNDERQEYDEQQEEEDGDGEVFLNSEDEDNWNDFLRKTQADRMALECKLLQGAVAFAIHPPPPPQQQLDPPSPVLTSFLTKDGYIDHSLVAACAVHELSALALDNDGFFWTKDGILNQLHYQQTFPRPKSPKRKRTSTPNANSWTHASRASAIVKMEHTQLANTFTDESDWEKLFPSIVSESKCLRFLYQRSSSRNPDGSLQLIQIQLQATTPIVPKRTFVILRACKKIDPLTWIVADISVDSSRNVGYPCGCLIQGIADGLSEVTWVEHLEFEESYLDHELYNYLSCRGFAFGAERWVACLERSCERLSYRTKTDFLLPRLVGQEDPWEYEKKCVMRFSKRMVRNFYLNIGPPDCQRQWPSCVPAPFQSKVYLKVRKSPYHDNPKEMVMLATTTFSLPHSPEFVFKILGDERRRHELDASGRIGRLTEVTCYTTGDDPRNKISVQTQQWFGNEVLLQEASVNRSGSLVVWSLLRSEQYDPFRLGQKPSSFPLIGLSGVAISSNSHQNTTSSSSNTGGGSIVTLGLQQEAHDIKELGPKTKAVITKYIRDTLLKIVAVLNNPKGPSPEGVRGSN